MQNADERLLPFDNLVTNPKKRCSIAEGFDLLNFPLNKSYVRRRTQRLKERIMITLSAILYFPAMLD